MAHVDWKMQGPKIASCNCDYGRRPHRAIIRLPEGFEFRKAEVASDTFGGEGAELGFRNRDLYAALTYVVCGPYGIVP